MLRPTDLRLLVSVSCRVWNWWWQQAAMINAGGSNWELMKHTGRIDLSMLTSVHQPLPVVLTVPSMCTTS